MLLQQIQAQALQAPTRVALEGQATQLTYRALVAEVARLSGALKALTNQATVALALDNSPAWIALDLAILAAGCSNVPVPAFFTAAQKQHAIADAGVSLVFTDMPAAWQPLYPDSTLLAEWEVAGQTVAVLRVHADDRVAAADKITYTSGTTGAPKGVCLSAQTMWQVASAIRTLIQPGEADRHFCVLPLATLLENVAGVYASLIAGATVVVYACQAVGFSGSQFDISRLYQGLQGSRATTAILIPELLRALVMYMQAGQVPLAQLRFVAVGGAKVLPELILQAHALGLPVFEGYGLSECASVVALNTPQSHKPGSIGKPLPHVQLRVDLTGELWVKGALYHGYTQAEGGIAAPVLDEEGYLATGDLAYQDADGYVYLSGRKKDMFITSFGRNVSPEWVESTLIHEPALQQVCVFGEARPFNVAIVVPQPQFTTEQVAQAIAQANQSLPDYAQVGDVVFAKQPFSPHNGQLTANGRLKRDVIAAAYAADIHAIYQGI
ncbi:AMP-binding protein [Methylophilus sp. 5]|uniref:AMP-binding protein n=1 Tax=Methylophilus sp. 5 TaxID=1112274 RepID=UPI000490FF62|nr:AMP-binding protein [Methylophilus sp. 5]